MARIRTIKPEFFTSEDIVNLSHPARLLYIASWCEADRDGRLAWKPKTFKMRYFPADSIDIDQLCNELVRAGLVNLYGDGLAHIPTFLDHQHINPRETNSKLPIPDASSTRQSRVSTRANQELTHREEGKGKEDIYDASLFDAFYSAYPKKVAKSHAEKAWKKARISSNEVAVVMTALLAHKQSDQWKNESGKFIPNPATWINQRRWEDEVVVAANDANEFVGAI